jgi:kynurenine formamidase
MKVIPLCIALGLLLVSCANNNETNLENEKSAWIDLSYAFDSTTLYWPNNATIFQHHEDIAGKTAGGYYYSSYSVCMPEHGGTHLDAPVHFAEAHQSVDEIPLENLCGSAVVIDVSEKVKSNRDYLITPDDVMEWEKKHGQLPEKKIVLFRTGMGKYYPDREKYFGTKLIGMEAIPLLHFPGIDASCAEFLVNQRHIKAVGLDTPSMDYGQSTDFKTHQIMLGSNIPGFENVNIPMTLPSKGIYIVALPMKIGNGSGAPLRIIANVVSH